MNRLKGRIAVVTGASRGVGRGVAVALAKLGATVYASGRTISDADLPPEVIRVPCDHTDDLATARLFERVALEGKRLDILVNNAWPGYQGMFENGRFTWMLPFWEQPTWRWDAMMTGGVRAAVMASRHAAWMMTEAERGLIVNLSYWAAKKYVANTFYGIAKAATDKFTADAAHELRPHGVTVVSLYPGLVRTEAVLEAGVFDLTNSESPEFVGRAVAALATDPDVLDRSGQALVVAELARHYGFSDVNGMQPRPLTIDEI